jgi:hypothetical protein
MNDFGVFFHAEINRESSIVMGIMTMRGARVVLYLNTERKA